MKRVFFLTFALCIAFSAKAYAAAIIPAVFQQAAYCGTPGTSCSTGVLSAMAQVGDVATICVANWAGTAATGQAITINGSGTGISAWGSRFAQTNSVIACFTKTLIAGDPGSAIGATWTNSNQGEVFEAIWHPSDNVAPTFETPATHGCATAATCTPSTVTPTQNGDQVFFECVTTTGSGSWTGGGTFTQGWSATGIITGVFGWSSASGSPTMPVGNSGSGTPDMACFTGAVKASSAGSIVTRAGTEAYNSGAVTSTQPAVPTDAHASDVSFAGVRASAAANISPMPQTGASVTTLAFGVVTPASFSFVVNAGAAAGQFMTVCAWTGPGTITPPAGFTSYCTDNGQFAENCFYKTLVLADVGATKTWSSTNSSPGSQYAIWNNTSGTSWAINPNSACNSVAGSTTAAPTAINLVSNNEMLWSVAGATTGTVTKPAGETSAGANGNIAGGYLNFASPGSSGTQTFSSTGTAGWELTNAGIIRLTGTSAWTSVAHKINETGTAQVDVYQQSGLTAGATQTFLSDTAASLDSQIVNVGGLNTSTPVDGTVGTLGLEGMSNNVAMAVLQPTANDDLALVIDGFSTCSPGQPQANQVLTNVADGQNRLAIDYEPIDFAMTNHITESSICPYVSIAVPLQATSAPAQTSASIRLQQQIEEIWSLAPAPTPPVLPSQSYQLFISRNDPEWILADSR